MTIEIGTVLLTTEAVGGTWQYAVDLARALAAHNVEAVLAVLGAAPSPAQRESAADLAVIETGAQPDWLCDDRRELLASARRIRDIAASGFDIVQVSPALAIEQRWATVAMCHSCVATWWDAVETEPLPPDLAWKTAVARQGFARADAVVAPTAAHAAHTAAAYALAERPSVVHNGRRRQSTPRFTNDPAPFVFTAGRLWDRAKGIDVLDCAAAHLSVPLRAAGAIRAPHGETIALRHVEAMGSLDDGRIAATLADRPVFVSAARYEPFGLAVLEAAMAGCALVLADIPSFRELWDGAALFVAPDDAEGFARACQWLIDDGQERFFAGARARTRANRYTPARMASQMLEVYASARETWGRWMDEANREMIAAHAAPRRREA